MKRSHFSQICRLVFALTNLLLLTGRPALAAPPEKTEKKPVTNAAPLSVSRAQETPTLLDEAGRLVQPVSPAQAAHWRRSLHVENLNAERRSGLQLWLGEWELAQNQQPERAMAHFRLAQKSARRSEIVYGIAAYDIALTLYRQGAYQEAALAYHRLILPHSALRGYDGRLCAVWYRHANACAGYHAANEKLGIPEPGRLDPLCGVAALAECLRVHGKPYDRKTLLAHCKVTGLGNSLAELRDAAAQFDMTGHTVGANDNALRVLPMPLIAHVEGDHFVVLTRADARGISYLCSDCGSWPGGQINLTWKQWRAMNPGVYMVITPKHSAMDAALSQLALNSPGAKSGIRIASSSRLFRLTPQSLQIQNTLMALLKANIVAFNNPAPFYCGNPDAPHCPPGVCCASDKGGNGDPVNLAAGEEEYAPEADMIVYNPRGPSVNWQRTYSSLRTQFGTSYEFDDFGNGWSHSYNYHLYVSNSQIHLLFPNGSQYAFSASTVPTVGNPHVDCYCTTQGVPMYVGWDATANGYVFTVWNADRTRWVFQSNIASKDANPFYSLAKMVNRTGQSLNFVYSGYGPVAPHNSQGFPLLTAIADDNFQPLLTISRSRDGYANVTSVSDHYGRSVYYVCKHFLNQNVPNGFPLSQQELITASQIVKTGLFNPPFRFQYDYVGATAGEGSELVPLLQKITLPSPTGTGTSTATIFYKGYFVDHVQDGNGNTRYYTVVDALHTKVTVKDAAGNSVYIYTSGFDPQSREVSRAVGPNSVTVTTTHYSDANMIRPDTVTDGNGKITAYQQDPYGNLQTQTSPRGTITVNHWDYSVFPLGELKQTQEITAAGVHKTPTKYTYYEPSGLVQTVSTPLPGSTDGRTVVTTSLAYDTLGNLTTITAPGNNAAPAIVTTLNYTADGAYAQADAIGQPLTVTDNLGHASHFRYDAQGNLLSQSDALGYATTFAYNLANQRIETDFPYNPDPAVQPAWRAVRNETYLYPGGPMLTINNYQVAIDGSGSTLYRQVNYGYGANGELLSVKGSTEPVTYLYDGAYRLSSLSDGNGHATLYAYNTEGHLKSVTYPNGDTTQYPAYDAIGDVTQRIDGRGITTNYKYIDPENKLTNVQYVDSPQYPTSHLQNVSLTYDDYGRRAAMTDGTGSMTYGYDDRDASNSVVTTYNDPTGTPLLAQTISYAFYPDGSRQSMTTPAGTFNYGYDQAQRMNSLTNPYSENFGWTYQDNNWLLTQRLGAAAITTYAYAPGYGWMTGLTTLKQDANKTLLSQFSALQYDPASNLTGLTANLPAAPQFSGQTTYGYASQTANVYESRDQLTQEQSTRAGGYNNAFNYDGAGNPTTFRSADPTTGARATTLRTRTRPTCTTPTAIRRHTKAPRSPSTRKTA